MDGDTVKGIVILILILAGGAGLWIVILHWKLRQVVVELAKERRARAGLERELAHHTATAKAKGASDEELLDDVAGVLRGRNPSRR